MAQVTAILSDRPAPVTLGSVVAWHSEYGVVWHVTADLLRVLPIARAKTSISLSLANEVALHLPVSLGGWYVAYDELVAWPRAACAVSGELDERCLLKILNARKATQLTSVIPAYAANPLSAGIDRAASR